LLEQFKNQLRIDASPIEVRTINVDDQFDSPDQSKLLASALKLSKDIGVVVVDALSLYDDSIARVLGQLGECYRSESNAVIVPALTRQDDAALNDLLLDTTANTLLQSFLRPRATRTAQPRLAFTCEILRARTPHAARHGEEVAARERAL